MLAAAMGSSGRGSGGVWGFLKCFQNRAAKREGNALLLQVLLSTRGMDDGESYGIAWFLQAGV